MEVVCTICKAALKISKTTLQQKRAISVICPKCKNNIPINRKKNPPLPPKDPLSTKNRFQDLKDEVFSETYKNGHWSFDFEVDDMATALLCEQSSKRRVVMKTALSRMNFKVTAPISARESLKRMRYHSFNLVVLNETFDCMQPENNHILKYCRQMAMSIRRNIFIALITDRFKTRDAMAAYYQSVDMVINLEHIPLFESVLGIGLSEHTSFYRVFKDALKKSGKT